MKKYLSKLPIIHIACYLKGIRIRRPTQLPSTPARIAPSDGIYLEPIVNNDAYYIDKKNAVRPPMPLPGTSAERNVRTSPSDRIYLEPIHRPIANNGKFYHDCVQNDGKIISRYNLLTMLNLKK